MIVIVIAVRIYEMRISASIDLCSGIHQIYKFRNRTGNCFCDYICAVITGKKHGAVQNINKTDLLAGFQVHCG